MDLATSNRRLLKLADFLQTLPRQKFDYTSWIGDNWNGESLMTCGTTACALGWATAMPEFRRVGLQMEKIHDDYDPRSFYGQVCLKDNPGCGEEEAGMQVFGLTSDEFNFVFVPVNLENRNENGATPKQVASKIRKFVKARKAIGVTPSYVQDLLEEEARVSDW